MQHRPEQRYLIDELNRRIEVAIETGEKFRICASAVTGLGKCLSPETLVLDINGHRVRADSVKPGMHLIGPDSKPRKVLATCSGTDEMYKITPKRGGDPFICNGSHILSLATTTGLTVSNSHILSNDYVEISVDDYFNQTAQFKHCTKLWSTGLDFGHVVDNGVLSPYMLGVWLGDGTSSCPQITTSDAEVIEYIREYCQVHEFSPSFSQGSGCWSIRICDKTLGRGNRLLDSLREENLINNKHIPHRFMKLCRRQRLELVAGIIDTDGYLSGGCYDIVMKQVDLAEGLKFLCRSLGLTVHHVECEKSIKSLGFTGTYQRLTISGDIDEIPVKVERRKASPRKQKKRSNLTQFKIESLGKGPYSGFMLDGDGLFLLSDFTVTHNSLVVHDVIAEQVYLGRKVAIYSHRILLTEQIVTGLKKLDIPFGVRAAGNETDADANAMVQMCSLQTEASRVLKKRDEWVKNGGTREGAVKRYQLFDADVVFIDEMHAQTGEKAEEIFHEHWKNGACIIGVTATPLGVSHILPDGPLIAGNSSSARQCGAILPAVHYACEEICSGDVTKVSPEELRGELWEGPAPRVNHKGDLGGFVPSPKLQQITACVIPEMKRLNPDNKPWVGFAPGVPEARYLMDECNKSGISAACIDCNDVWVNGQRFRSNKKKRAEVISKVRNGEISGLWNRFVLREGIDIPNLAHLVLATPVPSLKHYVQTVGRVLRSDGKLTHITIQDHGASYYVHGDANDDRDDIWREFYFHEKDDVASRVRKDKMRSGELTFPDICVTCRKTNTKLKPNGECSECAREKLCPECGAVQWMMKTGRCYRCDTDIQPRHRRLVIQTDGSLQEVSGLPYRPFRVNQSGDMESAWQKSLAMGRAIRKKRKREGKAATWTYAQCRATIECGKVKGFEHLGGQTPPPHLPGMPLTHSGWYLNCDSLGKDECYA